MGKKKGGIVRKKGGKGGDGEERTRIAVVNSDKCKPKKCRQECRRHCPIVMQGKACIEVTPKSKLAFIAEPLCVGCGICTKKCPFEAITIINLPSNLSRETTHRYGPNSFKLHRLPMPRPNEVLGLVGTNGIGKSTALKVLSGRTKPNLGRFEDPPGWEEILRHFRGSELQGYFNHLLERKVKAVLKPQYVDSIPTMAKGTVERLVTKMDSRGVKDRLLADLQLEHLLDRNIDVLSGGELQRFAMCIAAVQDADVYMFDEPSSYLDVKQRLIAAQVIRELVEGAEKRDAPRYVICVEHDLAVLDYLSDYVCVLYGSPGSYGVVTLPISVREGINVFLAGYIPTENIRFRDTALSFDVQQSADASEASVKADLDLKALKTAVADKKADDAAAGAAKGGGKGKGKPAAASEGEGEGGGGEGVKGGGGPKGSGMGMGSAERAAGEKEEALDAESASFAEVVVRTGQGGWNATKSKYFYPAMAARLESKSGSKFELLVEAGFFSTSQIIVLLGENGCGKSTLIQMLAGLIPPSPFKEDDADGEIVLEGFAHSYKPQKLKPKFEGTVRELFHKRIPKAIASPLFQSDVVKPLEVERFMDSRVLTLSGGELQRVGLIVCLGKPAHVYLIDEPSAYLDSEQRIHAARVIKRFTMNAKRTAFVVEHDFIMATYLADRVIVYEGEPGVSTKACMPQSLLTGMNRFLKHLRITFRRDKVSKRPRINRINSVLDREQKAAGNYFFVD